MKRCACTHVGIAPELHYPVNPAWPKALRRIRLVVLVALCRSFVLCKDRLAREGSGRLAELGSGEEDCEVASAGGHAWTRSVD